MKKIKIIISGGGTGGHIYPAIAVAQSLQKMLQGNVEFLFVGASDRMEMEKIPKAGYKIIGLWISGLQRRITYKNFLFPFKIIYSVVKSLSIIKQFKPDVAIGFGGYASGAMLYAATLKKIPSLIHEQNSYAGITNKILKNRVDKICVAYDGMQRFFPEEKIVKTGNPIREDLQNISNKKDKAIAFYNLDPNKKTLLVIGGSLGARPINESIFQGIEKIKQANINLIWQTGESFSKAKNIHFPNFAIQNFIYEMDLAYSAADVVISRAGALSIAELCLVEKPVILVPSPNVAEDHQTKNATSLSEANAAILIKDLDAKHVLIDEAIQLLNDTEKQNILKNNIAKFSIPNAAEMIANEVLELIATKNKV